MIFSAVSVSAEQDERLLNALKNCQPYTGYGSLEIKGVSADYKTQVVGLDEQNRCVYKKYVTVFDQELCTVCKFTRYHISEIVRTMNTYEVGYNESGEEVNIEDVEAIKNTPVVKLWNRYLNDPSICNVEL